MDDRDRILKRLKELSDKAMDVATEKYISEMQMRMKPYEYSDELLFPEETSDKEDEEVDE